MYQAPPYPVRALFKATGYFKDPPTPANATDTEILVGQRPFYREDTCYPSSPEQDLNSLYSKVSHPAWGTR